MTKKKVVVSKVEKPDSADLAVANKQIKELQVQIDVLEAKALRLENERSVLQAKVLNSEKNAPRKYVPELENPSRENLIATLRLQEARILKLEAFIADAIRTVIFNPTVAADLLRK